MYLNQLKMKALLLDYEISSTTIRKTPMVRFHVNIQQHPIKSQKGNRADGHDSVPSEIIKRHIKIFTDISTIPTENEMGHSRKEGIATFTPEKIDTEDINNYRPIVLLIAAHKIRGDVIPNRLTPIANLPTSELQRAYKKIGPLETLYTSSGANARAKIKGRILIDSPRAFDRIDRWDYGVRFTKRGYPYRLLKR